MDHEKVLHLLGNIKHNQYVGTTEIEVVNYAVTTGLLVRTSIGNFELSPKGENLLNNKISWDDIIK